MNESTLLKFGFKKQYIGNPDGFYRLDISDKLYFTIDFKTLTLSIQLKGYGHIQKLKHIKSIEQVKDLYELLNGNSTH